MKKLFILLFSLIFVFCGCNNQNTSIIENLDILCGYYIEIYNGEERLSNLSGDYLSNDGIWVCFSQKNDLERQESLDAKRGNTVIYGNATLQGNFAENGSLIAEEYFHFTKELLGKTLKIYEVKQKHDDLTTYVDRKNVKTIKLQGENLYTYSQVEFSSNIKTENKEFLSNIKLFYKQVDYLNDVEIIEYDQNNVELKNTSLYLQDNIVSYFPENGTKTIILKEKYQRLDSLGNVINTYEKTTKIDKTAQESNNILYLNYPLSNGLVNCHKISIKF